MPQSLITQSHLICIGFNHRSSSVALREQLNCPLQSLKQHAFHPSFAHNDSNGTTIHELALLSTCNRWELYSIVSDSTSDVRASMIGLVAEAHQLDVSILAEKAHFYRGDEAIQHLHRVACGLESQVLGEDQVLGQVSGACREAVETASVGIVLDSVFRSAISAGRSARTQTAIANHPASISSVALAAAQAAVGDLSGRRVLVVGLGEMAELALKSLRARGVNTIGLVNRTYARALAEAKGGGYRVWPWQALAEALTWADVVITATGASTSVISAKTLHAAVADRRKPPLVIVDIAVPRDVAPDARSLPGVRLIGIEDLEMTLDENLAARRRAIPHVEAIISQEMACLDARLQELAVRPLITNLRHKAEAIRSQELQRTLKYLGDVEPETLSHIQHLSHSLVNKLLHEPTVRLRAKANQGEAELYIDTVRDLFDLEV